MKVAVKDACVLIDLANGGLLEAWFQLGIETFTTDLVLRQVKEEEQWKTVSGFVAAGLLQVHVLTSHEVEEMDRLLVTPRIGAEDRTVLFLAIKRNAILITGDRRLRMEGISRDVDVRGLLWVLDELVARTAIDPKLAAVKLELMRKNGAFLPVDECEKRLQTWRRVE
jgi:predicted nucleic acid-binding protein